MFSLVVVEGDWELFVVKVEDGEETPLLKHSMKSELSLGRINVVGRKSVVNIAKVRMVHYLCKRADRYSPREIAAGSLFCIIILR